MSGTQTRTHITGVHTIGIPVTVAGPSEPSSCH